MRLSIITINYNNAEGLRKTLASVAAQTYPNIEHIIVDGGSTDGSVDVIREYESTLASSLSPLASRLKWVSEPDKGIYNAMNKGIEIALGRRVVSENHTSELYSNDFQHSTFDIQQKSDYIQILNSGDILAAPDVTERMVVALQQCNSTANSVSDLQQAERAIYSENSERSTASKTSDLQNWIPIFYGNMIKEHPNGKRVKDTCFGDSKTKGREFVIRETEWTMYDFIKGTINHDPTYIHRSLYEKYGLYDDALKIVSDWKWFVQSVVLGDEKVFYIPIDVTIFDMTGISETNLKAREDERRREMEKMFPMAILKDYYNYHFPIDQIRRLKRNHMWPLVYFIERVLFKLEKWGILK